MAQIPVEIVRKQVERSEADLVKDLERVRNMAERLTEELNRRIEDFNGCKPDEKVERFSWAINEVENFSRNVDSATSVKRAADYAAMRMWLITIEEERQA